MQWIFLKSINHQKLFIRPRPHPDHKVFSTRPHAHGTAVILWPRGLLEAIKLPLQQVIMQNAGKLPTTRYNHNLVHRLLYKKCIIPHDFKCPHVKNTRFWYQQLNHPTHLLIKIPSLERYKYYIYYEYIRKFFFSSKRRKSI